MNEAALLTEERRRAILERLRYAGKVRSAELSLAFGVSEDTIRRDLRDLAETGLLQRVHGGALPRTPTSVGFAARRVETPGAKEALARAAVCLLRPGQIVILDAGTTTLQVARHIPPDLSLTVVTNSPPIAVALAEHQQVEVYVVGGRLYRDGLATVGAAAFDALRAIHADVCILGVAGLHPEVGLTVLDLEEAHIKRAMMAGAADVVALAAAEKLGTAVAYSLGPLDALTHLVTERTVPEEMLRPYRAAGLTIIQA
jgi:DeoR/GlpR family transcriptional regulator of sugar metabolism